MTPLSAIVTGALRGIAARCRQPQPDAPDPAVDPVAEAWMSYGVPLPPPSVFAKARTYADESTLIRLVNQLAWEGGLAAYGRRDYFSRLAQYIAGVEDERRTA